MRWQYENVENPQDTGELHTCTKPCKGDRLDFFDGREWLVERVTLRCLPMQITEPIPIVGVLQLRPMPDMDSKILETPQEEQISVEIGMKLYNNRKKKVYEVFGKVSPCETDEWKILYRDPDWDLGVFRCRPESEFFGLNRDRLPRFVVIPDRYTEQGVAEWVDGYQSGLRFPPVEPDETTQFKLQEPQYTAFQAGYKRGKLHLSKKFDFTGYSISFPPGHSETRSLEFPNL